MYWEASSVTFINLGKQAFGVMFNIAHGNLFIPRSFFLSLCVSVCVGGIFNQVKWQGTFSRTMRCCPTPWLAWWWGFWLLCSFRAHQPPPPLLSAWWPPDVSRRVRVLYKNVSIFHSLNKVLRLKEGIRASII